MTTAIEKDAAWLVDRLHEELPKADVTPHKPNPRKKGTGWVIDAIYRDHYVVVMWTKTSGFGISTPSDDDAYDSKSDETIKDPDTALERVTYLLRTGEKAGASYSR